MVAMWLGSSRYEAAPPVPTLPPLPGRRVLSHGSPWLRALVCLWARPWREDKKGCGERGRLLPALLPDSTAALQVPSLTGFP